jgi:hypothetical protein
LEKFPNYSLYATCTNSLDAVVLLDFQMVQYRNTWASSTLILLLFSEMLKFSENQNFFKEKNHFSKGK